VTLPPELPVPAERRPIGRILLVVEQLRKKVPGGIGTVAAGLAGALGALDPALRLRVALYASATSDHPDPLLDFGLGMLVTPLPTKFLPELWAHGIGRPKWQFSVVHATSTEAPPGPSPLVVTVHDLAWRSFPEAYSPHGRRWHEAALRRHASAAVAFVVPSRSVADALIGAGLDIAPDRVEVIEWGVDHLPPPDVTSTDQLLDRLGVYGDFLLSVGTLEPRKNLERVVAAYAEARDHVRNMPPLVVVGPNGWGRRLRGGEDVVLAGSVPGAVLAGLYARARALVYAPLLEGFGFPVVEAMAAGLPVVASDVPAAAGAALLVDPLDIESIASGLLTVVRDERRRAELRAAGLARTAPLTWAAAARAHVELWERVGVDPAR
jgi:glycosyltransferase involved in cell wall biosynthesis